MNLNEAVAVNRVIKMRLFDTSSPANPLPLAHAFSAGDVKIVQPDNTIANATNLPVSVAGAVAGTFDLALAQSELQEVGSLRVQISATGVSYYEWVELVVDPSINNTLVASATAAAVVTALASTFGALPAATAAAVSAALASAFAAIPAADASAAAAAVFAAITDANAPVGCKTFAQQWNYLLSVLAGDADGLDGTVGSTKSLDTTKHRSEFTVFAGKRTFTLRDGT